MTEAVDRKFWTADEDQQIRDLWMDNTAGKLAVVFKRSRSAVIARAHRLGLKKAKVTQVFAVKKIKKPKRVKLPKDNLFKVGGEKRPPRPPSEEPMKEPFIGVHLLEIKSNQCRFMDDPSTMLFCGHEVQEGSSYCANHHKHLYTGIPQLTLNQQRSMRKW